MTPGGVDEGPAGLPAAVARGVVRALSRGTGRPVRLRTAQGVGGGCIHNAVALETSAGPFFLKWNRGTAGDAFTTEARSLVALRRAADPTGELVVPRVWDAVDGALGPGRGADGMEGFVGGTVEDGGGGEAEGMGAGEAAWGWLLLEYLPPSRRGPGYAEGLGRGLATLHRAGAAALSPPPGRGSAAPDHGTGPPADAFGWPEENRIGSLPQLNPWTASWPEFWRESRLRPHLEALVGAGALDPRRDRWAEEILDAVEPALAGVSPDRPHLLHGDLWSGNVHPGPSGQPVLVDPASCLGHGEVDLAMARLFGGFDDATFQAYGEVVEVPPGFEEVRLPLYQLYYLLVHVRLFGAGYIGQTRRAAGQVVAAVR